MAISAIPILPVKDTSANGFVAQRLIEEVTQTFLAGTPIALAADGGIEAWDGATGPAFVAATARKGAIVGVSYEGASNLSATGSGAPAPMAPFTGIGAVAGTFGSVPNQASAKNIAHGAPMNDGRVGFILPTASVVFSAMFGNNGAAATPTVADVGVSYGLTLDSDSKYWYVDKNKATRGTNTVVTVVGLDPRETPAAGSRVLFTLDQDFIDPILLA